ncbi:carbohydrate kinase [Brucella anthropi]|uniref:FGGY-family carbohydrate kinase n=1 Tax=Brucella/Ochrobactrum group TaxID=2826938 RepID=UPI00124CB8FA|nr:MULTISPECIES: FGGY-family carbohydrate kinase [Brucella/Ochrobactrum group]KAB2765125.1 carbohydrate kinase [Brucella anthropi]KAB2782207.1 carbohydrate kinase [Brucella anthropi]MCQ9143698.1 FGGY-family carbohydrate kinase [Ochrobactrum sp. BTU2]UGQ24259.1 FGGY-family carbohydrate kinase [Brucella anthropi]
MKRIAILDIGKTNAKVVVLDAASGEEIVANRISNTVLCDGPYPHYDIEALWRFFLKSLAAFAKEPGFDTISITTHGAAAALVAADGTLAMPVLDYELDYPAEILAAYAAIKPDFKDTFSPPLSLGLNLGAQLHYLKTTFPADFARAHFIFTYPQYWAWRLTGIAASEVTSLGCHTDLWLPKESAFSPLVDRLGIRAKLPPLRSAFDALGEVLPEIATEVGLCKAVPVHCGIHDSNASLLAHLMDREAPFSVVSTGTWVVSFAVGGNFDGLDPERDTLANVDAYGRAVPSARYMGGREFDIMTEGLTVPPVIDQPDIAAKVLVQHIMALPSAVPGCGPYPSSNLRWINADTASDAERYVAACIYAALMTETCLHLLGADGPVIVEGPFAGNPVYLEALANFTGRDVEAVSGSTGTSLGAGLLAGATVPEKHGRIFRPGNEAYAAYRKQWIKNTA